MTEPRSGARVENRSRFGSVLYEIVDAAIAISGADFGNIQLIDPKTSDLRIVAHRGFPNWWLDYWNSVSAGHGVCGTALACGKRVIVEDVEHSPIFIGTPALEMQRKAGVRAVQSTPIISREGKPLGMFSTHYKMPKRPDERGLLLLDLLARQAADLIERKEAEEALEQTRNMLDEAQRIAHLGSFEYVAATRTTKWSEEEYRIYGLDPAGPSPEYDDLLARHIHPDDVALLQETFTEAMRNNGIYELEHRIVRPDGCVRWVYDRAHPYFDAHGKLLRYVGATLDITERKRAEQALKDSERRLAVALEASASAVWEMDVATGTVRGENYIFTMLGYFPGELRTRAEWRALFHPDERQAAFEKAEAIIEGRCDHDRMELRVLAKDGRWCWILVQAAVAQRDAQGRALRLVGTYTDVHGRKEMEEALRRETSRLQSILDNAPLLVSIRDFEGRMALANRAYYEMMEVPPPEQFIGRSIFELFPAEAAKLIWANDQEALAADGSIRTEENLRHRDGCWHTYLTIRFPVKDIQTGKAKSLCTISIDITDRKAAEAQIQGLNAELENRVRERTAQLQESNEALLQSNTELRHFAHAAAHDLQTPLRSIAGFTQLLQKEIQGQVNERVDEWSATVVENTKRLQILIQEILSYTRLETQGRPFEMTDLQRLFDEVVSSLAVLIGETQAEVTCSALPALLVDRTQIAQVFQNLIENGIKYNRSKPPRITVSCELQGDQWVFSVADNGIGIDPKHFDRVFELFKRLHPYHEFPGTGIGVPLCRRIVERHGGHLWIESRPGEGSVFYFSLPAESNKGP